MKWSIALLSAILATACSSVKVREQSGFALESGQTFAWAADADLEDVTGVPIGAYLEAVTRELAERGVQRARGAAPALVVDVDVQVETRVRQNDPVVELFVAEEYEQATLTISILSPDDGRVRWSGDVRHRLRYTRRSTGGFPAEWYPLNSEREWYVDREVARVLSRLAQR